MFVSKFRPTRRSCPTISWTEAISRLRELRVGDLLSFVRQPNFRCARRYEVNDWSERTGDDKSRSLSYWSRLSRFLSRFLRPSRDLRPIKICIGRKVTRFIHRRPTVRPACTLNRADRQLRMTNRWETSSSFSSSRTNHRRGRRSG